MTDEEIIRRLPEVAWPMLCQMVLAECPEELGDKFISFKRVSTDTIEDSGWLIWEDGAGGDELGAQCAPLRKTRAADCRPYGGGGGKRRRARWCARCRCLECGAEFYGGYLSKDNPYCTYQAGITLYGYNCSGELYPGIPDAEDGVDRVERIHEGDPIFCPYCESEAKLIRESDIKGGRTYSVLAMEPRTIGDLTTLMYWRVCRYISMLGTELYAEPFEAIVLEGKRLRLFSHHKYTLSAVSCFADKWKENRRARDPESVMFYDYGAFCGRKAGAVHIKTRNADFTGQSAEKTGLDVYLQGEMAYPTYYLQLWKKEPHIENLMRAGARDLIFSAIRQDFRYATAAAPPVGSSVLFTSGAIDWKQAKPHKMLGLSREEFRLLTGVDRRAADCRPYGGGGDTRTADCRPYGGGGDARAKMEFKDFALYKKYRAEVEPMPLKLWLDMKEAFELDVLANAAIDNIIEPLSIVVPYLDKQYEKHGDDELEQTFIDYRRMLRILYPQADREQLWPRRLQSAHDRFAVEFVAKQSSEYDGRFKEIFEKYKALEWTDGELCIKLPQNEAELKAEGKTLRHCVGSYGREHIKGNLIFFVRHYRRPERSYYTLNIDMRGKVPVEVQLHGYGNERHGENKEHRHGIPQRVRDFVKRWENEILMPWWAEQQKKGENAA